MFGLAEIWFLIGIPILATIFLLSLYRRYVQLWELGVIWGVSILSIFIAQAIVEKVSVSDKEYVGYLAIKAEYDEPFSYWSTCTRTVPCGKDTCTETYSCIVQDGDKAYLINQLGVKLRVNRSRYLSLEKDKWSNSETINLNRKKSHNIVKDGNRRVTVWPGLWHNSEPIALIQNYENKIKTSTTFRFLDVNKKDVVQYGLFKYPPLYSGIEVATIMDSTGKTWGNVDTYFRYLNGKLGPKRLVRVWILLFYDQPMDAFYYQQSYWKNGNKNEFVVCIGLDSDGSIKWGDVFSWTEVEDLKIDVRDYINITMKEVNDLSLMDLGKFLDKEMGERYIKPDFRTKLKHLSVQPSTTSMIITAIFILAVVVAISSWVVCNRH